MNVGHPEGQDELEKVLTATIGEVFPNVMRDPIEDTNTLLVASAAPLSAGVACAPRCRTCRPRCAPTALAASRRLAPPLRGGEVYTDDRAPVEWLIDKSIMDYASGE